MPQFQTDFASGKKTLPNSQGDEVVSVKLDFAVSAAMVDVGGTVRTALATNDVIDFGKLPAGHVLTDFKLVSDDIDTSTGASLTAGLLNAGKTGMSTDANADGGNVAGTLISASNVGQAGGTAVPAATNTSLYRLKPLEVDRSIGVLVATQPTTQQAGVVSLIVSYRAAHYGA